MSDVYDLPGGKKLHRWTDSSPQDWACELYDHGPMCRGCVMVDDVLDSLLQNVVDGLMEIGPRQPGEQMKFRVTDEGKRRVKAMIERAQDDGEDGQNRDSA